jgi:hypothetical protein
MTSRLGTMIFASCASARATASAARAAKTHRAFDERLFSVVLTPYWDKLHSDHFHFDLARYHVDGTRAAE